MRTNSRLSMSPVFLRRWEYGFVWKGGRGIYNWKWYSANWETNSQQKPANKCNYKSFLLLIAASVPSVEKRNKLEKEYSNFFCRFFPNYFRKIVGHWRGKTYTGHACVVTFFALGPITVDHNDPSKPSHRLTNGPEPSKTIESNGSNIKKPS